MSLRICRRLASSETPIRSAKSWKPSGRGMEVLDDGANNLCNHDLALIVLELVEGRGQGDPVVSALQLIVARGEEGR